MTNGNYKPSTNTEGQFEVKCPCGAGFKSKLTGNLTQYLKGYIVGCPACGRAHERGEVDAPTLGAFADMHEQAFGEVASDG